MDENDDVIGYIVSNFDPDDIVEALELSTEDLISAFPERLETNLFKFTGDVDEREIPTDGIGNWDI